MVDDLLSLLQLASMCFPQGPFVYIHICTSGYDDLDKCSDSLVDTWTCTYLCRYYRDIYWTITGSIVVSESVDSLSRDGTDTQYLKNPKKSTTNALYIVMVRGR